MGWRGLPTCPRGRVSWRVARGERRSPVAATWQVAGTGEGAAAEVTRGETPANGEGYDLKFENAPVATRAKVILGDILGVGYTIDPRVQGTVSLASGRPVPKADILYVL